MIEAEIQLSTDRSGLITKFSSTTCTARVNTMIWCIACIGSFLFVGSVYAQSLIVAVSGAQFTTYVEAEGWPVDTYPAISRTSTASSPVSDEIDLPVLEYAPMIYITNHAIASADLFGVSAKTGWGKANASATVQLLFSPLYDQTQTIGIQISNDSSHGPYTAGSVSMLDLTSNTESWNYGWTMGFSGADNIPWDLGSYNSSANFSLDTAFVASHEYELMMMTSSNAGDDSESVSIQLTGLQAVPEPSFVFFSTLFGASLMISRRLIK
jgi:hypothetical protein